MLSTFNLTKSSLEEAAFSWNIQDFQSFFLRRELGQLLYIAAIAWLKKRRKGAHGNNLFARLTSLPPEVAAKTSQEEKFLRNVNDPVPLSSY